MERYELDCELRREIQDLRDTEGKKPSGIDLSWQCVQSHFQIQSSFSALELIRVLNYRSLKASKQRGINRALKRE